jgi:hypothetical protein
LQIRIMFEIAEMRPLTNSTVTFDAHASCKGSGPRLGAGKQIWPAHKQFVPLSSADCFRAAHDELDDPPQPAD